MGDYYIIKLLNISYKILGEKKCEYIELNRKQFYFSEYSTSDSDDSTEDKSDYIMRKYKKYLEVVYEPRVLYMDGNWRNDRIKNKYEKMILRNLAYISMGDIESIIKEEVREFM